MTYCDCGCTWQDNGEICTACGAALSEEDSIRWYEGWE